MTTGRLLTRRRQFLTALVCLDTGLVAGCVTGRDKGSATRLLAEHAPDAEVVACDLFSGFKTAADSLEGAVVVTDVFQLVRLGLAAPDEVRRRRQQQIHGHRGRKHDPLFRYCAGSCESDRNGSTSQPARRSTTGCGRPTPMTRLPPPGSNPPTADLVMQ